MSSKSAVTGLIRPILKRRRSAKTRFGAPMRLRLGGGRNWLTRRDWRVLRWVPLSNVSQPGFLPGWGAPLYAKLDSELAAAMMSINAVKAVEIGAGFEAARLRGEENADPMRPGSNAPEFLANNAGGIAGGISTGQPLVCRVAFKPTSSILTPVETITRDGEATEIITKGRHDPCVGIRGTPVVEAMMALVLADQKLLHRAQCG